MSRTLSPDRRASWIARLGSSGSAATSELIWSETSFAAGSATPLNRGEASSVSSARGPSGPAWSDTVRGVSRPSRSKGDVKPRTALR